MVFQLGTALLDSCVLAILKKNDTYGYALTQSIKEIIDISESTLYPVLRRLEKENCLLTYDKPFQGRNRRYYHITDLGNAKLQDYISEWEAYKMQIDKILIGGKIDEQN